MKGFERGLILLAGGLSGLLVAGCAGPDYQDLEGGEAVIPQIDLERPAVVETATFALG